jgi:hypothetical protein
MVDRMDKTFLTVLQLVACWLLKLRAACEAGLRGAALRPRPAVCSDRLPLQRNFLSGFSRLQHAAPWEDHLPPPGSLQPLAVRALTPFGHVERPAPRRRPTSRLRH